jgi:2-polyprenyl-3-methyl-5-hydroxy-6-metoxy-1,4-benzoquinol methylase
VLPLIGFGTVDVSEGWPAFDCGSGSARIPDDERSPAGPWDYLNDPPPNQGVGNFYLRRRQAILEGLRLAREALTRVDLVELPNQLAGRHPWEQIRFQFFFRVLAGSGLLESGGTALDVGAGDAWFAEQLASRSDIRRIVCWDTAYSREFLASRRLSEPLRVELTADQPAGRFDLLLLLDVLEHVKDADLFLTHLVRDNLSPTGHALISVPACPSLFSSHDVRLRHYRRYTPALAEALVGHSGLEIVRSAGLFHSLGLVRAIQVSWERVSGRSTSSTTLDWNMPPPLRMFVQAVLAGDGWLSLVESRLRWTLPGLSWWALCRRASRQP